MGKTLVDRVKNTIIGTVAFAGGFAFILGGVTCLHFACYYSEIKANEQRYPKAKVEFLDYTKYYFKDFSFTKKSGIELADDYFKELTQK
ncbi:MAG: hypothetical protein PHD81_02015 [Candidatus Nanoarchaeia archaeon]|nr:hypothetical protein [Candidatus Nanoarchaeia archaeon]MDD5587865.1 hypothetical protein [Candidatus Nanoarchaeia archaeon]